MLKVTVGRSRTSARHEWCGNRGAYGACQSLRWQPVDRCNPTWPTHLFCVMRCQPRQVLIFAAVEDQRPQVVVSVQVMDGQDDDVMVTGLDLLAMLASIQPLAPSSRTAPCSVTRQSSPSNRRSRRVANCRPTCSCSADRMLTPSRDTSERRDQVREVRAIHTDTSAGSSETDVKEFAVSPMGSSSANAATAVTPVGKAPKTRRSRAGSRTRVVTTVSRSGAGSVRRRRRRTATDSVPAGSGTSSPYRMHTAAGKLG